MKVRTIFLLCFSISYLFLSGCGTMLNSQPEYLGNNRYQVNVAGFAGLTVSSAITRDWNNAASKACGGRPYNIITRSFTGKDQNGMEGVIECQGVKSVVKTDKKIQLNNNSSANKNAVVGNDLLYVKTNSNLRKTPSKKAGIVKALSKGDKVKALKASGDWFLVELSDGQVGWCHKSGVREETN